MISIDQIFKAIEERQGVSNRSEHDSSRQIEGVASLTTANTAQVAFLAQPKYLNELASTQAGLILISEQYVDKAKQINPDAAYVIVKDAYLAYAKDQWLICTIDQVQVSITLRRSMTQPSSHRMSASRPMPSSKKV